MKNKLKLIALCHLLSAICISAFAQVTAFTYQGRLNSGGSPANGSYDLRFILYDSTVGGSQQGPILTNSVTAVSNGLFTVTLDFGNQFPGASRWLEIAVRTNGVGSFATLSPRQALTPAPYAIFANTASNVSGTISAANLSGTYGNAVTFNNAGNSFSGNGSGLTGVNAATLNGLGAGNFWQTAGNAGTTAGANFVGTTDNQPLELHVNGLRAFRLEPTANTGFATSAVNVIGGSPANFAGNGALGVTIAGGGAPYYFGSGTENRVSDNFGTIGGGVNNDIETNAYESTIAGGNANSIQSGAYRSTIGGGWANAIGTNCDTSFIGGGFGNVVDNGAEVATIGGGGAAGYVNHISSTLGTISGGSGNVIQGNANDATIGGGRENVISSGAWGGFIGGGHGNVIQANDQYSSIGGGYQNAAGANYAGVGGGYGNTASGQYATVPGGKDNFAIGQQSFAAGTDAYCSHNGSFVWADTQVGYEYSDRANQFKIRAGGGMVLDVSGSSGLNPAALYVNSTSDNGVGLYVNEDSSDAALVINNSGTGLLIKGFGVDDLPVFQVATNGNASFYGTIYTGSDRNSKTHFSAISPAEILDKIVSMPITQWNYKTDSGSEHIGPMAQDFHAAFGLGGEDDTHIAVVDEGGVALAAIQGLNQKLNEKDAEIQVLKQRLEALEKIVLKQKSN